jgi:dethiobiotin synthetase
MFKGFFITGTDTGVGKTIMAGALIRVIHSLGKKVCAMKPIESGCRKGRDMLVPYDGMFLRQVAGMEDPVTLVTPCCFETPLSPLAASETEGKEVDLDGIRKAYRALNREYEAIVVEGIGGLMVPLKRDYFVADMAKDFGLPLIIIARPGLGTINHTMLTVNHALEAGLKVAGVIINHSRPPEKDLAEKTNPGIIQQICPVPLIGIFPYLKDMGEEVLERTALRNFDLEALKKYIP